MNVGIYTITQGQNYGNRLQNYAVQTILEENNMKAKTLQYKRWDNDGNFLVKLSIKKWLHDMHIRRDLIAKRLWVFNRFNKKYVHFEKKFLKINGNNDSIVDKYDCFVTGSDQVWNLDKKSITFNIPFLGFAGSKKRVSISASFGFDSIDDNKIKEKFKKYLNEMDAISVREESGKKIAEQLTDKEINVLIDPTLMLSEDKWKIISKKPHKFNKEKYIFVYLLGKYSEDVIQKIRAYAQRKKLEVVMLENDDRRLKISNDEEYAYGPSEFVWLLSHSDKVITDSFHGAVFSLIHKKEFNIIPRNGDSCDMSTRITYLGELFQIQNMMSEDLKFEKSANVDYGFFNRKLKEEQDKFRKYLLDNLTL